MMDMVWRGERGEGKRGDRGRGRRKGEAGYLTAVEKAAAATAAV